MSSHQKGDFVLFWSRTGDTLVLDLEGRGRTRHVFTAKRHREKPKSQFLGIARTLLIHDPYYPFRITFTVSILRQNVTETKHVWNVGAKKRTSWLVGLNGFWSHVNSTGRSPLCHKQMHISNTVLTRKPFLKSKPRNQVRFCTKQHSSTKNR